MTTPISQKHSKLPVNLMITGIVLTSVALIATGVLAPYFISNSIPINYLSYAVGGAAFLGVIGVANMISSVILNKKRVNHAIQQEQENQCYASDQRKASAKSFDPDEFLDYSEDDPEDDYYNYYGIVSDIDDPDCTKV